MSREDLHAMFAELAEDVSQPLLVAPVVARAARLRRRRLAVTCAALVVFVVTVASLALGGPKGTVIPAATPNATQPDATGSARFDRLPATLATDSEAAPYWPGSANPPANAPSLAGAPISHAVMLYSPPSGGAKAAPVYVYGEGSINGGSGSGSFHWARIDVDLSDTRDAGGNRAPALDQNSLGPMGASAAFAQTDSVVIVNLTTAAVDRIPLPGLNEDVTWLVDGRHVLVSSATQTWLVDTRTRSVTPAAANGATVTALVGGASGLTTLTVSGAGTPPLVLRLYDDGGLVERSHRTIDTDTAAPYRIAELRPRGWRDGNLIAQAASGPTGEFVAVIDDRTSDITHVLDLNGGGGGRVLGWMNSDVVLVHTDRDGLLKWQLTTGTVTRLTNPTTGSLSIAPAGCDWTVTIADVTASCIT
jgi:hypothetical protein